MMSPTAEEGEIEFDSGSFEPVMTQSTQTGKTELQPISSMEVEQPLPSVAEITGRPEGDETHHRRSNPLVSVLVLLVVVLFSLTIGLAIGLKGEEDSKIAAIQEIEKEEEMKAAVDTFERYEEIVRFLSESDVSDLAALQSDGSPQQLAATFMAMLDPLFLPIPHSHVVREGYQFVTRYVLMVLYFATEGDQWTKQRHFKSDLPCCQWWELNLDDNTRRLYEYTGVICNANGVITSLLLPDTKMSGQLPTELGLLFSIKSIVLNTNRISGSVPTAFEQLINLQDLWLADNTMTGTVPSWIEQLVGLRSLDVSRNRMEGSLPAELANLHYVEMLALDNNLFSGKVSSLFKLNTNTYGGLKKLKYLYLEGNHFTGSLGDDFMYPGEFKASSPLVALDVSSNYLTGTIPKHLFSMFPNLVVIDMSDNMLTSKLPMNVLPNESLEFLDLHGNQLTGEVSGLLPDLQRLTHLDVSSNQFGSWHIDLGAMRSLTYLFLANNPFPEDGFPEFLSELTNLKELSLKSTQRTGTIPTFLGNMDKLVLLDLDDNSFEGTIPVELGRLSNLEFLLLNRNMLTSSVPWQFNNLQSLRKLLEGSAP